MIAKLLGWRIFQSRLVPYLVLGVLSAVSAAGAWGYMRGRADAMASNQLAWARQYADMAAQRLKVNNELLDLAERTAVALADSRRKADSDKQEMMRYVEENADVLGCELDGDAWRLRIDAIARTRRAAGD